MFACAVSNPYFDRIDPFWYSRLSGLKVAYLAVILFTVNAFFKSPDFPVLMMLVTAAATAMTELPQINTHHKKALTFIAFMILCVITISLFGLVSYFKWGLLIVVGLWGLLLYKLLVKDFASASLPGVVILIGILSLEGQPATDLTSALNNVIFYTEFGVIGFVANQCFPNFHTHVFKSAILRLWAHNVCRYQGNCDDQAFDVGTLECLAVFQNEKALLSDKNNTLADAITSLQMILRHTSSLDQSMHHNLVYFFSEMSVSVKENKPISFDTERFNTLSAVAPLVAKSALSVKDQWNEQCSA